MNRLDQISKIIHLVPVTFMNFIPGRLRWLLVASLLLQSTLQISCVMALSKLSTMAMLATGITMFALHLNGSLFLLALGGLGVLLAHKDNPEYCVASCLVYFFCAAVCGALVLGSACYFSATDFGSFLRIYIESALGGSTLYAFGCAYPLYKVDNRYFSKGIRF
ncbi:MAG: hypothetical protein K2X81_05400 [Candidatus Obscuribacterales bacterium]|nr:hypothetical protein [Candidatus Obscuribacterales bacterium]